MSLLKKLNPGALAPAPTAPVATAPIAPPSGVGVAISGSNLIAQLEAKEREAEAKTSGVVLTEEIRAQLQTIVQAQAAGLGSPKMTGVVAQLCALHAGQLLAAGAEISGVGRLGGLDPIGTVEKLKEVAADLAQYLASIAKPAPAVAQVAQQVAPMQQVARTEQAAIDILPPDAPESRPELAALPVADAPANVPTVPSPVTTTPVTPPAITTATLVASTAEVPAPAKKRGRPAKAKPAEVPTAEGSQAEPADGIEIYVDCVPSKEHESLQPLIDSWCDAIVACYKIDPPDVRCSDSKPCSFGGWRGVVRSVARDEIGKLAAGAYYIDSRSEINAEVAAALAACPSVALYVRGVR